MIFRFIWVGKTKDKNWRALQEEYFARLSHFVRCEITRNQRFQQRNRRQTNFGKSESKSIRLYFGREGTLDFFA